MAKAEKKVEWRKAKREPISFKGVAKGFAEGLLEGLLNLGEVCDEILFDRKSAYRIMYNFGIPREKHSKAFYELKRRGYLEHVEGNPVQGSFRFTTKAKLKVLDKLCGKLREDGKYRFVSFDIPEKMRNERDLFRIAIKEMGFRQIQKSLWAIDKNVGDLVDMTAAHYGIGEYVVYIVADKTDIDGLIGKMFTESKSLLEI